MTVHLISPISSSGPWRSDLTAPPVAETTAPTFIRGGLKAELWHRPRSGVTYPASPGRGAHTSWHLWCGQTASTGRCLARDTQPVDEPVCGTCEGRAIGAGQIPGDTDYETRFTPMWQTPPTTCPGSRRDDLYTALDGRGQIGRCLVCGVTDAVRYSGGAYNPIWGLVRHAPGPGLVTRCDFHGWRYLTPGVGRAVCACTVVAS